MHLKHWQYSRNKFRVAYDNAHRRVLGLVKSDSTSNTMFVNNRIENVNTHNRHIIFCMISIILESDNSVAVCLNNNCLLSKQHTRGPLVTVSLAPLDLNDFHQNATQYYSDE